MTLMTQAAEVERGVKGARIRGLGRCIYHIYAASLVEREYTVAISQIVTGWS
jgi:hypothetical protein